jgi:hypothetical protein
MASELTVGGITASGDASSKLTADSDSTGALLWVRKGSSIGAGAVVSVGLDSLNSAHTTVVPMAIRGNPLTIIADAVRGVFSSTGLAVTGTVSPSGGIQFPATQAASADANNLDDYEEGSWTPSLGGDTTYTTQDGQYTKVGRLVNISCNLQVNVLGTGSTSSISGLPFTSGSTLNPMANGAVGYFASLAVAPVHIGAYVEQAATTMLIPGTTAAASSASPALSVFGDSARIDITATYFI